MFNHRWSPHDKKHAHTRASEHFYCDLPTFLLKVGTHDGVLTMDHILLVFLFGDRFFLHAFNKGGAENKFLQQPVKIIPFNMRSYLKDTNWYLKTKNQACKHYIHILH